ncbi:MAG: CoA-binding protein [Desulfobacterales bacterium]|nr:CoA-binding protein [Desulfobacteraceae bacterium]MDH3574467.1 CoA-binding protein [Desulfobacteraceae bacterium]MDH3827269.1 CoA-binding protein [Desulfobacterales bacterium]
MQNTCAPSNGPSMESRPSAWDFKRLFQPKTVAVIGVSLKRERHPANVIFNKIHLRYPVDVFAVNPGGGDLFGQKVYTGIQDLPQPVDLAIIAVRAEYTLDTLKDCIDAGVGGATIISGGFAEIGRLDLQNQLADLARQNGFPFIGPNCLGIYVPGRIDTFFIPSERMVRPEPGKVALVSQSGGILVDQMTKFAEQGVGFSMGVSIGNKALVRELDLLEYLAADPDTGVIAFYIEGFARGEGRDFVQAARQCTKPVIVLKAGKTSEGMRAVSSHTASMAGDYAVFSAALAQHGIVEAANEIELVSFCEALSCYREAIDGRVGIISSSGGHGALAVDICSRRGLSIPAFNQQQQARIRADLSLSVQPIASLTNPIDLTGSATDGDFMAAAEHLSRLPELDCIVLLLLPYSPEITSDLGARLSRLCRRNNKALIAYVPHVERYRMLIEGFEFNGVPVSPSIKGAVLMVEAIKRSKPC